MISGGGSAQVDPPGGNAIMPPGQGATHWQDHIWFPTSPLKALKAELPGAKIEYNAGTDCFVGGRAGKEFGCGDCVCLPVDFGGNGPAESLAAGQSGCADRSGGEGKSAHDCGAGDGHGGDDAVAGRCGGVVEAWYAGSRGHIALANVLDG